MNAEFAGDGSDLPVLGVKQAANFDVGFWADHGRGSSEASGKARERVHPTAAPAADDAVRKAAAAQSEPAPGFGCGRMGFCGVRCDLMFRWCRRRDRKGTWIRHVFALAASVRVLAVAMIQESFGAALVAAVGAAVLLEAGLGAAGQAAVAVSTIAALTDPEDRLAAQTNSLTENHFAMPGHCEPQARLDNGAGSWHL